MSAACPIAELFLIACGSNDDDGGDTTGGTTAGGTTAGGTTDGGTTDGETTTGDSASSLGIPTGADAQGFAEGVVTAAHPLAAAAGAKVLAEGGNAIDAAVVVQFVLNVVEPTSSGIGGGGFMGIHQAETGRTFFIDSREKAPAAATPTQYLDCEPNCTGEETGENVLGGFTDIATSGIGVGVPGTLLGAAHALEQYGTLSLAQALAPAIELAANGFEINERLATLTDSSRTSFGLKHHLSFVRRTAVPYRKGFCWFNLIWRKHSG